MQSEKFRFKSLPVILLAFLLVGAALFVERSGVREPETAASLAYLPRDIATAQQSMAERPATCLVLTDSADADSRAAQEQIRRILLDMKVGCQTADVARDLIPAYDGFQTVVVLLSDLSRLGENVVELCQWVRDGGRAMFALTLQKNSYSDLIEQKLGILSSGHENANVDAIFPEAGFMLGGGEVFGITDDYESALVVNLNESARVHVRTADRRQLPLVWENDYGRGKFVVINMGIYEKSTRGFFAAAYSLLEDVCVYPVINASVFFLDDFLAPIPGGEWEYIRRDYQMDLDTFYKNVWMPDVLKLSEKYGVKFTGVIIENYLDDTSGAIEHNRDIIQYQYFGNTLLRHGGELGYHGHNHQPLCLENTNYGDELPYKTWESYEAMKNSVSALQEFCAGRFPRAKMSVYVPPSNILSKEGRAMLGTEFPGIRTVASLYFPDDFGYEQEFEVASDGVVELPRTVSNCVLDDYLKLVALSELNMHFVNSHFFHPDDVLDPERGAAYGWEKLCHGLDDYMDWIYTSAPSIRNMTGSEAAAAVQRFSTVSLDKQVSADRVQLSLYHFYDEACLMIRFNEGRPGAVTGGTLEHLGGGMYLLHADAPNVTIERLGEEEP